MSQAMDIVRLMLVLASIAAIRVAMAEEQPVVVGSGDSLPQAAEGSSMACRVVSQGIGTRTHVFSLGPAWQCGRDIANGEDYNSSIENMVKEEWLLKDEKTIKPWPNPSQAENWQSRPYYSDFNRRVYSPGFIYQMPQ